MGLWSAQRSNASLTVMPWVSEMFSASVSSRSVLVNPGITLFTVMPEEATSLASVLANPVTAARTAFDRMRPSIGCFTATEVMLMIRPHPAFFIAGSTARVRFRTLLRFCSTAVLHASTEWLSKGPGGGPPVFVTRISTFPKSSSAVFMRRSMSSGTLRSAGTATTSTPVASWIH